MRSGFSKGKNMSSTTLDSAPNASSENLSEVWRKFTDYMESEIRLEVHPDAIAIAQFAHKVARLSTATSVAMLEMRPTSRGPFFGTKNSKARRAKPPSLKWLLGDFEKALVEGKRRDDFIDGLREQANHQPTSLRECLKKFRKAIKRKDLEEACRASRAIRGEIVSSELLGRIEQIKPLFQEAIQQLEDAGNQFKTKEGTTIEARYCSNIAERLKSLKEVYSKHFEPLGQEHVPTDLMPKEPMAAKVRWIAGSGGFLK
jgi:ribosomal protein S20